MSEKNSSGAIIENPHMDAGRLLHYTVQIYISIPGPAGGYVTHFPWQILLVTTYGVMAVGFQDFSNAGGLPTWKVVVGGGLIIQVFMLTSH